MQGTRVTTAEDRGPTPVKLERVGWSPARGPYGRETGGRGGQGMVDGWMCSTAAYRGRRGCAGRV